MAQRSQLTILSAAVFPAVLLVSMGSGARAQGTFYHVERTLFRCSGMNRGLAFDGQHFWVGEYGGWIRCYDRSGRRRASRDLGGGSNKYLGHGVASLDGIVAAGAFDAVALVPKEGAAIRWIPPAVSGHPCAVASTGRTLWAMNYQSPVLYEMDLEGKLLRQFKTAQQSSPTSHDIAVDCDGHLYVLEGLQQGSSTLFEYSPDGMLIGTHKLATPATAIAIDPKDRAKTLYTVTFCGDPVVYEYRLKSGKQEVLQMPTLTRPLRYHPEGKDIVVENGENRFNRPLYGSNTAFFVYAGDLPEILLSLPGKGGTLWLGIITAGREIWLSDAERIVARYRAGAMRYEVHDSAIRAGFLALDVVPMAQAEGAVLKVKAAEGTSAFDLAWAFGGASGFNQWNLDTCAYCPESLCLLKPEDCENNTIALAESGFELRAPCHKDRPLVGTVPPGSKLTIANADKLQSPNLLLSSRGVRRPILAGRRAMRAGEEVLLALEWLPKGRSALTPDDLPNAFLEAERRREEIATRVRISTPDPFMNAAAPALCSAADGIWDPPVYVHGGVAWHASFLGWRGAYAGSEFGWHDRARTHFRTFAQVQLKQPVTAAPHADTESNLARQAADSVLYTRGYIPVHPSKDARGPYDMQQVYIDQLLWHLLWTGDTVFAREIWTALVDHLAWEKRCFDPDDDGLYENYANTFISDAHHYSGSPCTQASAYNYRAHRLAARLAKLLREDPTPFRREAERIRRAMNRVLWMPNCGWYAEYRDLLGLKRLHPSAELPSVYHPIDSDVPDSFQAYQMLRYVDKEIEHLPIDSQSAMLWSSNWVPFIWSIRDVCGVEVAHTALANYQAGRRREAYRLWRGAIIDSMFCCRAPGACIGTSELDAHACGLCTDFADTVGVFARTLVEGLFGIVPDALAGELLIRPGLPPDWRAASIQTADVGYEYSRRGDTETYEVTCRFARPMRLRLRAAARRDRITAVSVNGRKAKWKALATIGEPQVEITAPAAEKTTIMIRWRGGEPATATCPTVAGLGETFKVSVGPAKLREIRDPQAAIKDVKCQGHAFSAIASGVLGHRTVFARVEQGDLSWWVPVEFEVRHPVEVCKAKVDWKAKAVRFVIRNCTDRAVRGTAWIPKDGRRHLSQIGKAPSKFGRPAEALAVEVAPRSESAMVSLAARDLVPGANPILVDLGRGRVVAGVVTDWEVVAKRSEPFTWDCVDLSQVFNDRVTEIFKHDYRSPRSPYCSLQIPLHGYGDWCYCGKTIPTIDDSRLREAAAASGRFVTPQGIPFATPGPGTQPNVIFTSQWDNFPESVRVPLSGHTRHVYLLVAGSTHPMHSQLDNGEIIVQYAEGASSRLALHNPATWWPIEADYQVGIDGFCIPGPYPPRIDLGSGRATLLDVPLEAIRELQSLTVRCLANEVVVGLLAVTLLRPQQDGTS